MAATALRHAKAVLTNKVTLRILWLLFLGIVVYALLPTLTKMPE